MLNQFYFIFGFGLVYASGSRSFRMLSLHDLGANVAFKL